jgi:hypothetical protein
MKALIAMSILVAALALLPSCEDDPVTPPPVEPTLQRQPLTSRKAVLNNIEVTYNNRRTDVLDELLDPEFTFFVHPANGGLPVMWSRVDELNASQRLILSNRQTAPIDPVARSIRFDLDLTDLQWTSIVPSSAPGETWYSATVFYSFTIVVEPNSNYVAIIGAKAQLIVREIVTASGNEWRLVEWRDLGASMVTASNGASVIESTWGGIKALYR